MNDVKSVIINYIQANAKQGARGVDETTNFVEDRILDSFSILNLIMTLEAEYDIKFLPHELASPSLHTVRALVDCVKSKMK